MKMGDVTGARDSLERAEKSGKMTSPDDRIKLAAGYLAVGDPITRSRCWKRWARCRAPRNCAGIRCRSSHCCARAIAGGWRTRGRDGREGSWRCHDARRAGGHFHAGSRLPACARAITPASCRRTRTIPACGSSSPMSSCVRVDAAAGKELQAILDADATNEQATLQMARLALARRDVKEMERWGRKAIEDHPKSAAAQRSFALRDAGGSQVRRGRASRAGSGGPCARRDLRPAGCSRGAAQAAKGDLEAGAAGPSARSWPWNRTRSVTGLTWRARSSCGTSCPKRCR